MLSQMIAVKVKEREHMLFSCLRDEEIEKTEDARMRI